MAVDTVCQGMVAAAPIPVAVGPHDEGALVEAVETGGGQIVPVNEAAVLISFNGDYEWVRTALHPGLRWVQLGSAGVEKWLSSGLIDQQRVWTACMGLYAKPIAEHALALMLMAGCALHDRIRSPRWGDDLWGAPGGQRLIGRRVGILGCGGIGEALIRLLLPFDAVTIALTRTGREVPGASSSIGMEGLEEMLAESDYVVVAAPATSATTGLMSQERLALMQQTAWLVNVSRGALVDTHALVTVLEEETIGGAALDVVDPEPLPDDHPLWKLPNAIITPHVACPRDLSMRLFARRVAENLRRFGSGEELIGVVDVNAGY